MRGIFGFAVVLVGAPAGPVGAQAPVQVQPEIASHDEPVTFSSRVNLVSVPVVVRDHDGEAMGAFRQDDFQFFDKGKLQVITKFSIEKSGKAAQATEPANAPGEKTEARVAPGRYQVRVVVTDSERQSITARNGSVQIP
jgi:hypothetical protein